MATSQKEVEYIIRTGNDPERIREEEKAKQILIKAYTREGLNKVDAADKAGMSINKANRIFREEGIKNKPLPTTPKKMKIKLARLERQGYTIEFLGLKYGLKPSTVRSYIREGRKHLPKNQYDVNQYGQIRSWNKWTKLTIDDIRGIDQRWDDGETYREMEPDYPCSETIIRRWHIRYLEGDLDQVIREYDEMKEKEGFK